MLYRRLIERGQLGTFRESPLTPDVTVCSADFRVASLAEYKRYQ